MQSPLYVSLADFASRPAPFSRLTTRQLWTDPHIAAQMLRFHLDESNDLASRSGDKIDRFVGWIDARYQLGGKHVLDLGCGPGLYATRMDRRGAKVTGLDFSETSLAHARARAAAEGQAISYVAGDYLADPLPGPADMAILIYGDYCALAPHQRQLLCAKIRDSLAPDGRFILDLFSPGQFDLMREGLEFGRRFMGGFWAEGDYFGLKSTLRYEAERISLERYLVTTPERQFEIFNWMQYFTPDSIVDELAAAGFAAEGPFDLVRGGPWAGDATAFVMVARR